MKLISHFMTKFLNETHQCFKNWEQVATVKANAHVAIQITVARVESTYSSFAAYSWASSFGMLHNNTRRWYHFMMTKKQTLPETQLIGIPVKYVKQCVQRELHKSRFLQPKQQTF